MLRNLDRFVDKRFIRDDAPGLYAARGGQNGFGLRIIDPHGQFIRGKASKHNRMDRADPRAGQHRNNGFWNHRHIDDDPIAFCNAFGQ